MAPLPPFALPFLPLLPFLFPLLLLLLPIPATASSSSDWYCGLSWPDAYERCAVPCPGGSDVECPAGQGCHGYTGCADKVGASSNANAGGNAGGGASNGADAGNEGAGGGKGGGISFWQVDSSQQEAAPPAPDAAVLPPPADGPMCGSTWSDAMSSCSRGCATDSDCRSVSPELQCFSAVNCGNPSQSISSDMVLSLLGEYAPGVEGMNAAEGGMLGAAVLEGLRGKMEGEGVALDGADVTGQRMSRRRLAGGGGDEGDEGSALRGHEGGQDAGARRLPSYSSALEVSMVITGEYRPPPYIDVDLLIEDSINRASQDLVTDLKRRGVRGGTRFFESVRELSAVRADSATARPSARPTPPPTKEPTRPPSPPPTERAYEQMLQTGHGPDLYEGTARSFGSIFEVRTRPDAETVLVQGMDFYSSADVGSDVSYEVWTKEGPWRGFEGRIGSFTKVAEGTVPSRGACDGASDGTADAALCDDLFTRIPIDAFEDVAILGGGASRSFYVTLTDKELWYKRGESASMDESNVQVANPDIEVYEGAGVLMYPFEDANDDMFYRMPRGFLGRIWYERNPCRDDGLVWPCAPTGRPVPTVQPTPRPTVRTSPLDATAKSPHLDATGRPPPLDATVEPTKAETPEPTDEGETDEGIVGGMAQETEGASGDGGEDGSEDSWENGSQDGSRYGSKTVPQIPQSKHTTASTNVSSSFDKVVSTNLVLTLHNTERRILNEREITKYQTLLTNFLRSNPSLQTSSLTVVNTTIAYQKVVVVFGWEEELGEGDGGDKAIAARANSRVRRAKAIKSKKKSAKEKKDEISEDTPRSLEVTTIVKTAGSDLPYDVTDLLLLRVLQEESSALLDVFRAETFYTFFLSIKVISIRRILKITEAPTPAPTVMRLAMDVREEGEEIGKFNIGFVTGVAIGGLWLFLTVCGWWYLAKARDEMRDMNMLGETLGNQTDIEDTKQDLERLSIMDNGVMPFSPQIINARADSEGHSGETMLVDHSSSSDESSSAHSSSDDDGSSSDESLEEEEEDRRPPQGRRWSDFGLPTVDEDVGSCSNEKRHKSLDHVLGGDEADDLEANIPGSYGAEPGKSIQNRHIPSSKARKFVSASFTVPVTQEKYNQKPDPKRKANRHTSLVCDVNHKEKERLANALFSPSKDEDRRAPAKEKHALKSSKVSPPKQEKSGGELGSRPRLRGDDKRDKPKRSVSASVLNPVTQEKYNMKSDHKSKAKRHTSLIYGPSHKETGLGKGQVRSFAKRSVISKGSSFGESRESLKCAGKEKPAAGGMAMNLLSSMVVPTGTSNKDSETRAMADLMSTVTSSNGPSSRGSEAKRKSVLRRRHTVDEQGRSYTAPKKKNSRSVPSSKSDKAIAAGLFI